MYLELTDISKKIGADEVLSGITLSMEKGKVYGLQGKNGCGKSMLMRVICGLVLPTVGEVKIDGKILGKPADTEEAVKTGRLSDTMRVELFIVKYSAPKK